MDNNQDQPVQPIEPTPIQKKWYKDKVILIMLILVVIAASALAVYFILNQPLNYGPIVVPHHAVSDSQLSASTTTSTAGLNTSAASSNLPTPNDKYNLFVANPAGGCGGLPNIQYYDGGTISSGPYSGYHRVIAGIQACEPPGGDYAFVFATQDYKTFIASGNPANYESDKNSGPGDIEVGFNYSNVVDYGEIPTDSPPTTINTGGFVLVQNDYWYGDVPTTSPLTSLAPGLTFYGDPAPTYTGGDPDAAYLGNDDDILVKTPTGPIFDYLLVSKEEFSDSSGTAATLDGNFYTKAQISSTAPLYDTYGQIAPGACGGLNTTYLLNNISLNDLSQIGTSESGVALYTLGDPNDALNHDEYSSKTNPVPSSFSAYAAENPVILFQDPWGRWVGLGEFDNPTDGGCGKPVIYLYPPKPTEVTVKFLTPIHFSVDIPTYVNQWDVLANPDGELKDLQPQFTDCGKIDTNAVGSEYAQTACKDNDYPYLYWEGQTANNYPTTDTGWIVDRANISAFLDSKLTEIGLNEKEKTDMLNYWVPQLLSKDAPYYRMTFFQTQTMDKFIPMQITPQPDTVIRVFLDWSPLSTLPAIPLQPEVLYPQQRQGFTVVEWGGILK